MTGGGAKLRLVNPAEKLGHFTLLSIHLVIDLLLFGHLGAASLLIGLLSLKTALALGHEFRAFLAASFMSLVNGLEAKRAGAEGGLGLGQRF